MVTHHASPLAVDGSKPSTSLTVSMPLHATGPKQCLQPHAFICLAWCKVLCKASHSRLCKLKQ